MLRKENLATTETGTTTRHVETTTVETGHEEF